MDPSRRFDLVAVLGLDAYVLADQYAGIPISSFGSSRDWSWVVLNAGSAGLLDHDEVVRLADRTRKLVVEIRLEPGRYWTLFVSKTRKSPAVAITVHDELTRHLAAKSLPRSLGKIADVVARLDEAVPTEFRTPPERLANAGDSSRRSLKSVLAANAREIESALKKAGVIDARSGVAEALREGKNPVESADERLPCSLLAFLDAIRLAGPLQKDDGAWRVGCELSMAGSFSERKVPLALLAPAATAVEGGPVPIQGSDLGRLWLIPWCCDTDVEVDLLLSPPPGHRLTLPAFEEHWVIPHVRGERIYVEVGWNPPGPRFRIYRALAGALEEAPIGTMVEVIAANGSGPELDRDEPDPDDAEKGEPSRVNEVPDDPDELPLTSGNQRYRAERTTEGWFLTAAGPPVRAADLSAAVDLLRRVESFDVPFELGSAQLAALAARRAASSAWFGEDDEKPLAVGSTLVCRSPDTRLATTLFAFRARFAGGPWDVESGWKREEASEAEWDEMIVKVGEKVGEALAAPPAGDVIIRTERAVFRKADWAALKMGIGDALGYLIARVEGADEPPPLTPVEKLEPVDEALVELGFLPLGDIHCDRFGELYLRGYVGPDGATYASVTAGTFGQFAYELVSRFADGATLTTSTVPDLADRREIQVFKQSVPENGPAFLLEEHRKGIARRMKRHGPVEHVEPTLEGFCRAIDDYIAREID
ncbi:MAG: hypothetical protein U0794_05730 [Isosphaeraceae bacterium]